MFFCIFLTYILGLNSVFAQQIPDEPFQTDSLYSALGVRVVRKQTDMSTLGATGMIVTELIKFNENGLPIESKIVTSIGKLTRVHKNGEYVYDSNKLIRYNKLTDAKIAEFSTFSYNEQENIRIEELFDANSNLIRRRKFNCNNFIIIEEEFKKGILNEVNIKKYNKNFLLLKVNN
ncbi:MAG: hypothetical protein HC854_16190, partial [Flavobacterium sp.]|nr:hypothetical protein [Flavobacterium sp.]